MLRMCVCLLVLGMQVQAEIKPRMQDFLKLTGQVQPYLLQKSDYFDEKNQKEISRDLKEFNANVRALKLDHASQDDDMKFRIAQLADGLQEAEESFNNGFKDYSYWILKSSFNNCFACHTQKGLPGTDYKLDSLKKGDLYSQGEFLFIVRNYALSTELLEKVVRGYPKSGSLEETEAALQKLLFYNVRVSRDDGATLALFDRLLKNKELPPFMITEILAWRSYLNVKKYRLVETSHFETPADLTDFIDTRNRIAEEFHLSKQRYIVDLETSQRLFDLLSQNPPPALKPWVLYYLADQEKAYRLPMFDLSVENYLKECMEKFPRDKAAKKCFALYKEIQTESYTGTAGTRIPKRVQRQIDDYEKMVNSKPARSGKAP